MCQLHILLYNQAPTDVDMFSRFLPIVPIVTPRNEQELLIYIHFGPQSQGLESDNRNSLSLLFFKKYNMTDAVSLSHTLLCRLLIDQRTTWPSR